MGKTIRKVPEWSKGEDYEKKFERGHIQFPIKHNTDGYLYEDVWGADGKKKVKKIRNKGTRRQLEKELEADALDVVPIGDDDVQNWEQELKGEV